MREYKEGYRAYKNREPDWHRRKMKTEVGQQAYDRGTNDAMLDERKVITSVGRKTKKKARG
jgi:hypothetical protein